MNSKSIFKSIIILVLFLTSMQVNVFALGVTQNSGQPIKIDGYFDDWNDKPYSWEYNWNNPNDYWENGNHIYATDSKGKPYNETVRHKMSLYSDGQYIYLYIKMAKNYYTALNGYDYQFWINGNMAAFQVETLNGQVISKDNLKLGINEVAVKHRDSSYSWHTTQGAKAYVNRKQGGINDELELKIPLSSMVLQNSKIDIKNISTIEFFTPNLMYRRISCSGTSTAPYIGIGLGIGVICLSFYKKNRKEKILR